MLTSNYETDSYWAKEVLGNQLTEVETAARLEQYLSDFDSVNTNRTHKAQLALYIKGLLSNLERKSVEPIALFLKGQEAVRGLQNFMARSTFPEQEYLKKYQTLVADRLSAPESMLCIDESDFVKKGTYSPGVARQYCGRLGKNENCQAGVFLAYSNSQGHALLDARLYIPKKWFGSEYEEHRKRAKLPGELKFQTKNEMAQERLAQIFSADIFQIKWIGCDASFGSDHSFLKSLPADKYYFAAVRKNEKIFRSMPEMIPSKLAGQGGKRRIHPSFPPIYVEEIANDESIPWKEVYLGDGSKGPIYAETKNIRCVSYQTHYSGNSGRTKLTVPDEEVWLYIRKHEDGTIKYFLSNAPGGISREELDKACLMRWPIEQCFEECKSHLGMGDYESRTYRAWGRHMLLVMLAQFFITELQIEIKKEGAV